MKEAIISIKRTAIGDTVMGWLEEAARCSTTSEGVTRFFLTPEHRAVLDHIRRWMAAAGLETELDAIGNLVGRLPGPAPDSPILILGSHQDSVRQGGKYDGMLGIALPLACLAALRGSGDALPFAVEVVAFGDEEGGRFQTTLLGSRALAGTFDPAMLASRDSDGISIDEALRGFGLDPAGISALARDRTRVAGFVEVHIEQGPVLERRGLAVGVVSALTGIERHKVAVIGKASHAGTTPMELRKDALAAAAEAVLAVERLCRDTEDLVGVVGELTVSPGSVNVVPARCDLTVELRSPRREVRLAARERLQRMLDTLAQDRGVGVEHRLTYEAEGFACAPRLTDALERAVEGCGHAPLRLFSGAGHDGLAMKELTECGMLFVRCRDGLSHHPDEAITAADAQAAGEVLLAFLQGFEARRPA